MFRLYGITTYHGNDGSADTRKDYGTYPTYAEAMKAGCQLVWAGKADSYEVSSSGLNKDLT